MQLQEAIRTATVFECCSGLAMRPSVPFQICWNVNSWVQHAYECLSATQHFNAVGTSLKHSEYLQGMSGDQLTICAAEGAIRTAKALESSSGLTMRPKRSLNNLPER